MYTKFYRLDEKPFEITPDPRFLYVTENHKEALAHLIYGIREKKGLTVITGEVGTGKTTLIHTLLKRLNRVDENTRIAYVFNPKLDSADFLQYICEDLGLAGPKRSKGENIAQLNKFLLDSYAQNRNVVLIIDEAQKLDPELLEEVRLLTNLETATRKLLQIILIGQPELSELLNRPQCLPLKQRISLRYHLNPLNKEETKEYVKRRLRIAGLVNPNIFSHQAIDEIYLYSKGIPRSINIVCDNALLRGYAADQKTIGDQIVREVISNLDGKVSKSRFGILNRPVLEFVSRFSRRGMKRERNEQNL